jgi:hypothetical protein
VSVPAGELVGGPLDGKSFSLMGFWIAIPGHEETHLAAELLMPMSGQRPVPMWPEYPDRWVLVPPRPPSPPVYHYRLLDDKKYLYVYVGEWQWKC